MMFCMMLLPIYIHNVNDDVAANEYCYVMLLPIYFHNVMHAAATNIYS